MATVEDFIITEGKTFKRRVRWQSTKHVYVPILSMTRAGAVRAITELPHGIPEGERVAVISALGLTQLNAVNNPPKKEEYRRITVIDPTTIEFNEVSGASFSDYTSGGYLQYFEPMPILNTLPRWVVKDKIDGSLLIEATVANGKITVDTANFWYLINIPSTELENLSWKKAVHELETADDGVPSVVYRVVSGKITVEPEIATPVN